MVLPETFVGVLCLVLLSMLCWASWANLFKLAGKWRFELFYFDYAFGVLLTSVLAAFTFGDMGFDGFQFVDDLLHAGKRQWFYGFLAGVIFNLANMLLLAAVSVSGLSVAFPVGTGLALLIGVITSYIGSPRANAILLFSGCAVIGAGIVADAMAYRGLAMLRREQQIKQGKSKSTLKRVSVKGILLSLAGGVLLGCCFPVIESGRQGELGLGPYAITFVFALGVFVSTPVFNLFFMNLPVEGEPLEILDYFRGKPKQHLLGLVAGAIWCVGMISTLVAASAPQPLQLSPIHSFAIGQGGALLWGLLLWKEFAGSDTRVKSLVAMMLVLLVSGLAMVSIAPLFSKA